MSLEHISNQLSGLKKKSSPVEEWNPPFCGAIDLQIKTDGRWFYHGSVFKRLSLVKLFAAVLVREENESSDNYFLVTPVEKVQIQVADAPFVLTSWHWLNDDETEMMVKTNVDDEFILAKNHPLIISPEGILYVTVRRNLLAKVHRNIYYQWVELAKEIRTKNGTELVFFSAGEWFSLGVIERD